MSLPIRDSSDHQMGGGRGYLVSWAPEVLFPKLFLNTLSVLDLLRAFGISLLLQLGLLGRLIDPCDPTRIPDLLSLTLPRKRHSSSTTAATNLRQRLPVMRFSEAVAAGAVEDSCSVCLCEFEDEEEVRWLVGSCKHVFHKVCLDRWIDHGRRTCPLCRAGFLPGCELEDDDEDDVEEEEEAEVFACRWLCSAPGLRDW